MAEPDEKLESNEEEKATWFLRTGGNAVYGPLTLTTLKNWAADGRIGPGNEVSQDKDSWVAAETLEALQMNWHVLLKSGSEYGPFNLLAAPKLVRNGIIDPDTLMENRATGKWLSVESIIKREMEQKGEAEEPVLEEEPVQESIPEEEVAEAPPEDAWYLKIDEGKAYGPLTLNILKVWAAEGRIGPGNEVSKDNASWTAAENMPDLKMIWIIQFEDGSRYGPFNLLAAPELIHREIIAPDTLLVNTITGKSLPVGSLLKPSETGEREAADLDRLLEDESGARAAAPEYDGPIPGKVIRTHIRKLQGRNPREQSFPSTMQPAR